MQIQPLAVFTHCASHRLNLVLSKTCSLPLVRNMLGVVSEASDFMSRSAARVQLLEEEVETALPESRRKRVKALCRTRWVEQHDSLLVFNDLLPAMVPALERIQSGGSSDASTKATLLLGAICRFEFLVSLQMAVLLFGITINLSVALQCPNRSLTESMQLVENAASVISDSRDKFSSVFQKACSIASTLNVSVVTPRKTERQKHRANCGSSTDAQGYYRVNGWYIIVDETLAELERRFPRTHPALRLEGILPERIAEADLDEIEAGAATYDIDLPKPSGLRSELLIWQRMWAELSDSRQHRTLSDVFQMASSLPNIPAMLRILLTVPATSCSAERSFSALKRIESDARTTMGQKRL